MKVHFISIGGSVMHQLAIALKNKGYQVTGTDDEIFEPASTNLEKAGLMPATVGWNPSLIYPALDAVILGMHARHDNPELLKAQQLQIPIYSFPEYIYQESRNKKRIIIGGSHGKTTTTSMVMHVLKELSRPFDYLVGARLNGFSQSVQITDAPLIVCEGDEYPASALNKKPKFHFLFPHVAVITGIAWDHINVFPTFENYVEQFQIFINKIEPGGILIYNQEDPEVVKLIENQTRKDIQYQGYGTPKHTIENGITTVELDGVKTSISIFGSHNLMNLNAAFLACKTEGITAEAFLNAIQTFKGAAKRLEVLAHSASNVIFRDFAHAPSKVVATINAVKHQFPNRKLVAVLELHTYSSLNAAFLHQYANTLSNADKAIVYYSNHAIALKKLPPLSEKMVQEGFQSDHILVMNNAEDLKNQILQYTSPNTNYLFMSSGNYDGLDMMQLSNQLISHQD